MKLGARGRKSSSITILRRWLETNRPPWYRSGKKAMEFTELAWILGFGILLAIAAALPALALRSFYEGKLRRQLRAHLCWVRAFESQCLDAEFTIDEQGSILSFNAAAEKLFGYTAQEIRGQSISLLAPVAAGVYGLNSLHAAPQTPNGIGHEVNGRRKDGASITLDMRLTQMEGIEGRCFRVVVRDLSDRLRMAGQEKEIVFLRSILSSIGAPVLVLDPEGRVCLHSKVVEQFTGLEAGEIEGRNYWELMMPQTEWSRAKLGLMDVVSSGVAQTGETQWWRGPGQESAARVVLSPVLSRDKRFVEHVIAVGLPLVETAAAEPADSGRMEALERMAEGIARQFTELLTSISGYSELVLNSLDGKDPLRHDVEQIRKAGGRAAAFTLELLAFSGKAPMKLEGIQLNELIREVRPASELLLGDKIQLSLILDLGLTPARGDASWIRQSILTLAATARQTMPEGGKFSIETANRKLESTEEAAAAGVPVGDYVLLTATNTGQPSPARSSELLEPFHGSRPEAGLALGLSAVHGVARQCGGNLTIEQPPEGGTKLRFYLPRHVENEREEKAKRGLFLVQSASR